ncbi:MAG: hypothetical protein KJ065_08165 [Anaerolineae bacterium]|nr:hypothetical protein [Anaerolineae bacterium]
MAKQNKVTYYKDLSPEEERELNLWLRFLLESVENACTQITRWKRNRNGWDLQMFFVAVGCIDEAIVGLGNLGFFAGAEPEFWDVLDKFRRGCTELKLIDLRNNIHRDRLYNRKNKRRRALPEGPIFILGGYNLTTDEYTFSTITINVSDAFALVQTLRSDIGKIFRKKLTKFYKTQEYEKGMIPWTLLHSFETSR